VAVDRMMFHQPIHLGDLVTLTAEVSYVGNTSLEAEVIVTAENPVTGECGYTNVAYLVYVALGSDGKPAQVPPLITENDIQEERKIEGKARQEYRLTRRELRK
jgi:acyl-CoA hydrolase